MTHQSVLAAVFFVSGLLVSEGIRLVRDLAIENRRARQSREAEGRRWEHEDGIRAEAVQQALDSERRSADRDESLWTREVQGARRLVADELDTTKNHLAMMLRQGRYPDAKVVAEARFLSLPQWEEHKAELAQAMEDDIQFFNLAGFMYSTRQLAAKIRLTEPGTPFTAEERERLERMQTDAHALYWVVLGGHKLLVHDDGTRELVISDDPRAASTLTPYGPARIDGSALTDELAPPEP